MTEIDVLRKTSRVPCSALLQVSDIEHLVFSILDDRAETFSLSDFSPSSNLAFGSWRGPREEKTVRWRSFQGYFDNVTSILSVKCSI